jgi:2-polyprenyl-3-methyl-5-hydroxy-6-metoxy-1,4-benzoquinol methylase
MSDQSPVRDSDRTSAAYWDGFWRRRRLTGLATRTSYFHRRLIALLSTHVTPGASVLEVGCGGSVWLPALARGGADCWGIDYSRPGLDLLARTLERQCARATLVAGDFFDASALPAHRFDLVYSVGLVEHFSPPDMLLGRIAEVLAPGGTVITVIPNFTGVWGRLQRRIDRPVYDTHVVYAPAELDQVHADAGFQAVQPAAFFGGFAPLVVNAGRTLGRLPRPLGFVITGTAWAMQQAVAWSTHVLPLAADSRSRSGFIAGTYRARSDGPGTWP